MTVIAVVVTISSSMDVEATHDPNHPYCWEIGPIVNVNDTPTRYEYTYYYRQQCNYYNDNGLYRYEYTVVRDYVVQGRNYYDRDYY